jgi:hypothetical protein
VTEDLSELPESWSCVDCGVHTAPGSLNRAEMEEAIRTGRVAGNYWEDDIDRQVRGMDDRAEMYTVRDAVWARAGMQPTGGCLCVGCLEKRIGRRLKPKDFQRDHPFRHLPGTARLLKRQKR